MTVPVHLGPPWVSSDIVFLAFLSYINAQAPGHLTDQYKLSAVEAKIIFIGPPPPSAPWSQKWGGHCPPPHTPLGCAAHEGDTHSRHKQKNKLGSTMQFNYVKLLQQYAYWTMNRKKILNSINSTTTHLASYSLQSLTCYELCLDTNYCLIQRKLIRQRATSIIVKIHCNTHHRLITSLFRW